jgi:hypothetical protein
MNYFEFPIDLTFDKDKFLANPEIISIVNNIENFGLPLFNPQTAMPDFFKSLELLFESSIIKSRIFVYPPNFNMSTSHIDGISGGLNKWALNIPLFGTKNSTMNWFHVTDTIGNQPPNSDRSNALIFKITTPCLDSLELLSPHIVRTDIPHNVVNMKSSSRAILSIRFKSSIVDSIETVYKQFSC